MNFMLPKFIEILIEFGLVFTLFAGFCFIGRWFLNIWGGAEAILKSSVSSIFNRFVIGLLVAVTLYSIVIAKGVTINILLIPLLFFLLKKRDKVEVVKAGKSAYQFPFNELAFIAFVCICILHLFPESEYKQADAFFYLKISESLNITGQENISHYYNILNPIFHGVEPYHYFELWITSFIIRITGGFFSSILVERFVTHGILMTGIITGLYYLLEQMFNRKISAVEKLFCWSLTFFLPNILNFFPFLYKVFITDFEGNFLERPNFRMIYLLLIPIIKELAVEKKFTIKAFAWLLILSIVSFKCTVVIIPSLILYALYCRYVLKQHMFSFYWLYLLIFIIAFTSFYYFFGVKKLPSLYNTNLPVFIITTIEGWKFISYSIVTSLLYLLLLATIFIIPFYIFNRSRLSAIKHLLQQLSPLIFMGIMGLLLARILYLKDNSYQFLFIAHIIVSLFVWLLIAKFLQNSSSKYWIAASLFLSVLCFIKVAAQPEALVDTFAQNGNFIYEGKNYSQDYIKEVKKYYKPNKKIIGGYLCDSSFYKTIYYSRRNPNVYFLPITYIVSKEVNGNIELCLSDSASINIETTNKINKEYLDNAVRRSLFYQFQKQHSSLTLEQVRLAFIKQYSLAYLIVTPNNIVDPGIKQKVIREIIDPSTGERFLFFR